MCSFIFFQLRELFSDRESLIKIRGSGNPQEICTHFYRPQRSCGKVMFSQESVISDIPRADTPRQTLPPADTPLGKHTPLGRHPLPHQQTATAADGTHPAGMHSCLDLHMNFPNGSKLLQFLEVSEFVKINHVFPILSI